jgi:hypothetical protein
MQHEHLVTRLVPFFIDCSFKGTTILNLHSDGPYLARHRAMLYLGRNVVAAEPSTNATMRQTPNVAPWVSNGTQSRPRIVQKAYSMPIHSSISIASSSC